ncbi:MAG TPA: hypothetical protein DD435_10145 [Cyanobacteria bacterium UBA8530]|nr:hypothetical protein [Cyanobacteria bacterium UBA8530]
MRAKKAILLALSLSFMVLPAKAANNGEQKIERTQRTYSGSKDGKSGTFVEQNKKVLQFYADPAKTAAKNAFVASVGREPNDAAEIDRFIQAKSAGALDSSTLVQIAVTTTTASAAAAKAKDVKTVLDTYVKEFGQSVSSSFAAGVEKKISSGALTMTQLIQSLRDAKELIASNSDPALEWHSRDVDTKELKAAFGASGGWIDGYSVDFDVEAQLKATALYFIKTSFSTALTGGALDKATAIANGSGGDGLSIAGQSSRLLELAKLMESGLVPEGVFDVKGIFTHYTESWFPIPSSPYYKPITAVFDRSGGSWNDVLSLVVAGTSADAMLHAVYKWYSERWGQAFQIDVADATAAQLRAAAKSIYGTAISTASPITLDLSGNKFIGVTGRSTAQRRNDANSFIAEGSVKFDLLGNGAPIRIEWMNGENDALLVDDRQGEVTRAAQTDGIISGKNLFGNPGGYANGYMKLALILIQQCRIASAGKEIPVIKTALMGSSLDGLKAWIDRNHDAKVQPAELSTLPSLGITEIEVFPNKVKNSFGESLLQSSYVEHNKRKLAEDVWFAIDPKDARK